MIILGGRDKSVHALEQGRVKNAGASAPRLVSIVRRCRWLARLHWFARWNIYGINAKTGEKEWEYLLEGAVIASPAVAQGKLVIATAEE